MTNYSITVTNTNDSGAGSFRQAVADAVAYGNAAAIVFAPNLSGQTITLSSTIDVVGESQIFVYGDTDGDGTFDITISGDANGDGVANDGDVRLFYFGTSANVTLSGLHLTNGFDRGSDETAVTAPETAASIALIGGDISDSARVVIRDSQISASKAYGGSGDVSISGLLLDGGGAGTIVTDSNANLTIERSLFSGNAAYGGDAGPFSRGGDAAAGVLADSVSVTITQTGFSGVAVGGDGGDKSSNAPNNNDGGAASVSVVNIRGVAANPTYGVSSGSATGGLGGGGSFPGADGNAGNGIIDARNFVTTGAQIIATGDVGNDVLTITNPAARIALGFGGDDTINGSGGVDTIFGGAGDDVIAGGYYVDQIFGGAGNDRIVINGLDFPDDADGGAGVDTLDFSNAFATQTFNVNLATGAQLRNGITRGSVANIENVIGGGAADRLTGDDGANALSGGDGVDTLTGGAGNDTLTGGFQIDMIFGGAGDDRIVISGLDLHDHVDGGADNDTFDASAASYGQTVDLATGVINRLLPGGSGTSPSSITLTENVIGSEQADALTGDGGGNRLEGRGAADTIIGGGGNDTILGGGAGDVIVAGSGNDAQFGGAGNDSFEHDAGVNTIDGGADTDSVEFGGAFSDFVFQKAGAGLKATGAGGVSTIVNVETFTFTDGAKSVAAIIAATASDGADQLSDLLGLNALSGLAGGDRILGLAGADTLRGGGGDDTVLGGGGADRLFGDAGRDNLVGGGGNDTLTGGGGNDRLAGGGGSDRAVGGSGRDTLLGASGNDTLLGGGGNDRLAGGGANDRLLGGAGRDNLDGGKGRDILLGNGAADTLTGGGGNDRLIGGGGNDRLNGGAGADTLIGGPGNDTLTGGGGPDVFVFGPNQGTNVVRDFSDGVDRIDANGVRSFDALTIVDDDGDAIVSFRGTTIRLVDIDADQLDASDFLF